eukprot:TRINITY_DN5978_c0_g1_i2.p1 TRINITY_DN5978_c0_g1~~TRINITY_DN5978_c0_g1_i2.p1  ORF type:complete len:158 (+),score=10.58 TRINITY_DN5978_c0_g1_i2:67-540(+)
MTLYKNYIIYGCVLDLEQLWALLTRQPDFQVTAVRLCEAARIPVSDLKSKLDLTTYILNGFSALLYERFQISIVALPHDAREGRSGNFRGKSAAVGYLLGSLNLHRTQVQEWAQVNQKLVEAPLEHVVNVLREELGESFNEYSVGLHFIGNECHCCM